jgi:cytochrome c biogenesis protein CcdA
MKKIFISIFLLLTIFFLSSFTAKAKTVDVDFFYSETCAHCASEKDFLKALELEYPDININQYLNNDPASQDYLRTLLTKHNAMRFFGSVPLTFIEDKFFIGFDSADGIGIQIESAIKVSLGLDDPNQDSTISLPILGNIDQSKYSLPVLAVILGFLDGFNVCSLGALIMILSLVLALKSRKKILTYGLTFILATSIVYGLLMFVWYQIFSTFSAYITIIQCIIGLAAIVGSIYFFSEFKRMRKVGVTCNNDSKTLSKLHTRLSDILQNKKNIFIVIASILIFASLITIIEFPCSAAIPIVYAGILAQAEIGSFTSFIYIVLFLLFYMLDEIIIFLVAFFSMKLALSSPKSTIIITFIEAVILLVLGAYYLLAILN